MFNIDPVPLPHDGKFHTYSSIMVDLPLLKRRIASNELENWLSFRRQNLERNGYRAVEKTLDIADEKITCIGGNELGLMMRDENKFPASDIVSLQCRSDKDLRIMFVGEPSDVSDFYTLVSGIRKVE